MRAVELIRRAAGKSPGYLARRSILELKRASRCRRLRRTLCALTPEKIAREAGQSSLLTLWRNLNQEGFLVGAAEKEELRRIFRHDYALEAKARKQHVERILAHEFDLLGSGPTQLGAEIDWHLDFKSGRRWGLERSDRLRYAELDRPSDVKVPWELSRAQHLTALGRAWVVDRDEWCSSEFEAQIRSWIRCNPPGFGVNWSCTMEVGLRVVSWIWAASLFADAPLSDEFWEEMMAAIYRHGLWIPENLEIGEINGNHYISDALGMVACGALFARTEKGREWLDFGAKTLEDEIRVQVGDDGVDIEASVAYHRLVLEIFLVAARFLQVAGRSPSAEYLSRLEKMMEFVNAHITPEGLSPVVGDADDGRALILGETDIRDHRYLLSTGCVLFKRPDWKTRAAKFWEDSLWFLGPSALKRFDELVTSGCDKSESFPTSGFYILRSPEQYLFVDAGPVGFCGLGGHGHNDCLSFEWHAYGSPLLTDSGTYVYTASPQWRNRFRSTAFHNTIRVDREEVNRFPSSLALWSLCDDARPIGVRFKPASDCDVLEAGHTGYERLSDPVRVFRSFEFSRNSAQLLLTDRIECEGTHKIEFFFHAAPGSVASQLSARLVRFSWPGGLSASIECRFGPELCWDLREGWFSASYGIKTARPVWVAEIRTSGTVQIGWSLIAEK